MPALAGCGPKQLGHTLGDLDFNTLMFTRRPEEGLKPQSTQRTQSRKSRVEGVA